MDDQKKSISSFYRDRSILVTGATGFVGKVLVEKLLRSCSQLKAIYLLLRPKEGMEIKERLEDLLKSKVFDRIKEEKPDVISKLIAIPGDLISDGLGISASDVDSLVADVSVVFHLAANVKFNGSLKEYVDMNVLGTRRLLELCRKMKKIKALIHLSTAYSNYNRTVVEEIVYDMSISPSKIIDVIQWMDEDLIEILTPQLIRDRPNIYIYSKALAETLLVEESGDLPVAIVRPSIITAAWKEPFPGWVDNYNGPPGIIAPVCKGMLRSMYGDSSCKAEYIPVDVVANLTISVGWFTAVNKLQGIKVYNCTNSSTNVITWEMAVKELFSSMQKYQCHESFGYPSFAFTTSRVSNYISLKLFHYLPAYFYDLISLLTGKKPRFVQLCEKIRQVTEVTGHFISRNWIFRCDNVLMLQDKLTPEDKIEFNFSVESLHWPTYLEEYYLGILQHLLHETIPTKRET